METRKTSMAKVALKYGVLIAGLLILLSFASYKMGFGTSSAKGWIENLIIIGGIFWSMKIFRDDYLGGYMEFGQGVGFGTLLSLFGGILNSIYLFIFLKYIDADFLVAIKEEAYDKLMQSGSSDAELDMIEKIYEMVYTPEMMLIGGIIGAVLGGVIISLILAAILKKSKSIFD